MKIRKTIGALLIIAGIAVALCTPDNCRHELLLRGAGVAAMFAGCVIGKYFDDGKETKQCRAED